MQKEDNMTTNEIADIVFGSLCERGFPVFLTSFEGATFSEADVFAINQNGYMYEFEIKRSRSDFLADFKNKIHKHRRLKESDAIVTYNDWKSISFSSGQNTGGKITYVKIPNRFFFVCESGLISPEELPDYCGLVYVSMVKAGGRDYPQFEEVKSAKLLHRHKATTVIYKRIATILSQRVIYGCSYFTHTLKNNENN